MLVDADLLERAEAAHRRAWPKSKRTVLELLQQPAYIRRIYFGYEDIEDCCRAMIRSVSDTREMTRWWQ